MNTIKLFPGYEIYVSELSDGDFRDENIAKNILRPRKQIHGDTIHTITGANKDIPFTEVDGVYTREHDICIGALCADCPVIILIGDGECAAIHSGWRGAEKHIVKRAIEKFSTPRESLFAYIGPHIHASSYEVGTDFLPNFPTRYYETRDDRIYFDLGWYIRDDILAMGIPENHIVESPIDTFTSSLYHSYRRDKTTGVGCVSVKML